MFFIVFALIAVFSYLAIFGVHNTYGDITTSYIKGVDEIRWGIDIQGGVNATFEPADGVDASDEELQAAKTVIEQRLVSLNITDSEVYVDTSKDRVMVSFPWASDETDFNAEAAVNELGDMAELRFVKGSEADGELIMTGTAVKSAAAMQNTETGQWIVSLELDEEGTKAFAEATKELKASGGYISAWMDDVNVSVASVKDEIKDGNAMIIGDFTFERAKELADKINAGALPIKMVATSTNTISPTLGEGARNAMVIAGIIALAAIIIYMIVFYRLPGFVAGIALCGQVAGTLAAISGFFGNFDSFTLTIPGIAGIILAIGMGVDANVITAERIKEELRNGKTLNGAIELGYKRAWSAVFDSNITVVFVAVILMGAFGPTDSIFGTLLKPLFFAFGASTAGTIYSLGYTLLVGILLNFVFGIFFSRLMLASLSKFKCFRKLGLYNGIAPKKEKKTLSVVSNKAKFYAVSCTLAVLFVVLTIVRGLNVAVEFEGGTIIEYNYTGTIDTNAVADTVKNTIGETVTVTTGESMADGSQTVKLTFASKEGISSEKQLKVKEALAKDFKDNGLELLSSTDVAASNGKQFFAKCLVAVLFAALVMVIYIGFRFKKIGGISAGVMSVVALIHDMIMVYGAFVIFGFSIDSNFMAVLLTILGYSINATIIIYDRIRENRRLLGNKAQVDELVNKSVTETLGRSVHTTVTTVMAMSVVCVVCYIYGITSIMSFALPIIVGMLAGVYSSNCIAPTLWVIWQKHKANKAAAVSKTHK